MFESEVIRLYSAFIGLGSNIEPRLTHMRDAVSLLRSRFEVQAVSAVYATVPFGHTAQPEFLNAAARILTQSGPLEVLRELKAIERQLGRQERPRWHEREIDLDLLFFEEMVLRSDDLMLPHPGIEDRAFVLIPLADLDANFVHPLLKRSVRDLLDGLDASGVRKTDFTLE
jgi:2-amino-4-hydroxy-6-hydroxymethyldihydropteridine diphosphokinase